MTSRKVTPGQLRGPWVPAPAKSSSTIPSPGTGTAKYSKGFILPLPFPNASSSSSYNSIKRQKSLMSAYNIGDYFGNKSKLKTKVSSSSATALNSQSQQKVRKDSKQVIVRKPSTRIRSKHGSRRTASGYKLQSKDSLVDVTACLQAKRAEVMKIWEKNLMKNDPDLLSLIETTNRLALEAAEEVEILRRTIQDFQKKDGLTDSDCEMLNDMRTKVLKKVREFEEADNNLQDVITRKSASKISLVGSTSKTSQTGANGVVDQVEEVQLQAEKSQSKLSQDESKQLKVIKGVAPPLPSSESEDDDSVSVHRPSVPPPLVKSASNTQINFPDNSIPASASASVSLEALNRLGLLYQDNLSFLRIPEEVILPRTQSLGNMSFPSKTEFKMQHHHQQQQRSVRFEERIYKSDSETQFDIIDNEPVQSSTSAINDELYQQKISRLQRKLMETEQEVEELKSEIERIESDANFRVRMLQNSVQDKFDNLSVIPEYLQMLEFKINENSHVKTKLQQELHEKDKLLAVERETSAKLRKENDELRDKLKSSENAKELVTLKNYELERNISQLRKEIDDMARKYTDMAAILRETESFTSPRSPHGVGQPSASQHWEVQKLKLQCSEMKDRLSQSKRIIHTIRKSKEKMARGLNEKLEELMDALQEAQHHKRILGDQIRFLKKSYHELFPPTTVPVPATDNLFNFILNESMSPITTKPLTTKHRSRRKEPVIEPPFESKHTWQTGTNSVEVKESHLTRQSNNKASPKSKASNATYDIGVTSSENDDII